MPSDLSAVEDRVRAAFDAGDIDAATTAVIEGFGPEIFGFLIARVRSESDATEVFSDFTLNLWRGLPKFEWRCPVRVWAYTLARHAANSYATAPHRRPARNVPLSHAEGLSKLQEQVRSRTAAHLRTETQSKMLELRQRLPPDDQTLLILRVDRGLSWRDLARVMADEGAEPDEAELERASARLRQQFQYAKARLRKMAEAEQLIE